MRSIAGPIANAATIPPTVVMVVARATVLREWPTFVSIDGSQLCSA